MRTWKRWARRALAMALTTVVWAAPASATPEEAKAALDQRIRLALEDPKTKCRDDFKPGQYMTQVSSYTVRTTLQRGVQYDIMAAGSSTITNLDLTLLDEDEQLMSRDSEPDNSPIIRFKPKWTGTYFIKVIVFRGQGFSNLGICYR